MGKSLTFNPSYSLKLNITLFHAIPIPPTLSHSLHSLTSFYNLILIILAFFNCIPIIPTTFHYIPLIPSPWKKKKEKNSFPLRSISFYLTLVIYPTKRTWRKRVFGHILCLVALFRVWDLIPNGINFPPNLTWFYQLYKGFNPHSLIISLYLNKGKI